MKRRFAPRHRVVWPFTFAACAGLASEAVNQPQAPGASEAREQNARDSLELTSPLLGEGAILQREQPIRVAGRASPGVRVRATLGKESKETTARGDGTWWVVFEPRPAGGPLALSVTAGKAKKTLQDLFVGDVWVCSGQSNMEWPLRNTIGAEAEIQAAHETKIRHFKIPRSWAAQPSDTLAGGSWLPATSQHVGDFSAVAYYFAKKVHAVTSVPIGLVGSNWGGSAIEAWMSPKALGKAPEAIARAMGKIVDDAERSARAVKKTLSRGPGSLVTRVDSADADYSEARQDTAGWITLEVPGLWEEQGFVGMDGVIWYRKTFELTKAEAQGDLVLGLARIDDNDTTWVNGQQVGQTHAYAQVRRYTVPAEAVHAGKNSIAIRVEDTGGGGGIYSEEELLFVQTAGGARHSLKGSWQVRPDQVTLQVAGDMQYVDTALYNKMIRPLMSTPIKGVLWYQGETNAGSVQQASQYAEQFRSLIQTWRESWKQPKMPFYWVQLASFESGWDTDSASPWAILRESQSRALSLPQTGQAITLDVGNAHDIHPRDKKTVGYRLARIALNQTYGQKHVHFRGPVFASAGIEGTRLVVRFQTTEGLTTRRPGKRVEGFELEHGNGVFLPVQGEVKGNAVFIPFTGPAPTAVRYAWDDNPEAANLQDRAGLPAEPFRAPL